MEKSNDNNVLLDSKVFNHILAENIPQEMKALNNWVCWKLEEKDGRKTKVPYQIDDKKASTTNPNTWNTFETVCKAAGNFNGIGFCLTEDSGIMGVDFDHVKVNGKWDEAALEEIKSLNSYTELSQSGEGAHVICSAKIPGERRRSGNREIYSGMRWNEDDKKNEKGRFFVVTGNWI